MSIDDALLSSFSVVKRYANCKVFFIWDENEVRMASKRHSMQFIDFIVNRFFILLRSILMGKKLSSSIASPCSYCAMFIYILSRCALVLYFVPA